MQDLFGSGYTLLDLSGTYDSAAMEAAFAEIGAPLEVIRLDEPHVRETLKASVLLIRPDLHIAWRETGYPIQSRKSPASLPDMARVFGPDLRS